MEGLVQQSTSQAKTHLRDGVKGCHQVDESFGGQLREGAGTMKGMGIVKLRNLDTFKASMIGTGLVSAVNKD